MHILLHNHSYLESFIIAEKSDTLDIIARVSGTTTHRNHSIITVTDLKTNLDDVHGLQISLNNVGSSYGVYGYAVDKLYTADGAMSTNPLDDLSYVKELIKDQKGLTLVEKDHLSHYTKLARLSTILHYLLTQRPLYNSIIRDGEEVSIVDLLFTHPNKENYINRYLFATGNLNQLIAVTEELLASTENTTVYNPITQEEQVSLFLEFNKSTVDELEESVSDEYIEEMKSWQTYKDITKKLTENGFKLSPTQQFNSLQHLGLILNDKENIMYNLADMGSGKTLMTVETIVLAQELSAHQTADQINKTEDISLDNVTMQLPNINIIAPTLSLKSSWIQTFELFWDITRVDDATYTYQIVKDGLTFNGTIYLAGFTVKAGNIHVANLLPDERGGYLIIDEIHQLIHREVKADKFIDKMKFDTLDIYNSYKTFVLSGTLANLTTTGWYNLVQFLSIPSFVWGRGEMTAHEFRNAYEDKQYDQIKELSNLGATVETKQNRRFDTPDLDDLKTTTQKKMTGRECLFHTLYGANIVEFMDKNNDMARMLTGAKTLTLNPEILSTPNFELFYKLVSPSVVTAESVQIATELFGEQKTQHKAQVIKTKSDLNENDLKLLKQLYKLVSDVHIYKSNTLAINITNAILNLNDGLSKVTIYDLLNKAASKSERFLKYLTTLDIDLLTSIQESNLINQPKLEDTEKFKIVKDILANHKDDTFLIVVNSPEVVITLSKALNIKHLTTKEMRDDLEYQSVIDALYEKQNIVIVPQHMIKSSLDLVQANHLIQYQLNAEISDIIQTQNRINRIGQTRETRATYIATDVLQENIIELFLEAYRNIKVAHKGIVELFVDMEQQVDVVSDYLGTAFDQIDSRKNEVEQNTKPNTQEMVAFTSEQKSFIFNIDESLTHIAKTNPVIWYGENLITRDEDGNTIILATIPNISESPQLVTIQA